MTKINMLRLVVTGLVMGFGGLSHADNKPLTGTVGGNLAPSTHASKPVVPAKPKAPAVHGPENHISNVRFFKPYMLIEHPGQKPIHMKIDQYNYRDKNGTLMLESVLKANRLNQAEIQHVIQERRNYINGIWNKPVAPHGNTRPSQMEPLTPDLMWRSIDNVRENRRLQHQAIHGVR